MVVKLLGRSCWGTACVVETEWKRSAGTAPQLNSSIRGLRLVRLWEGLRTGLVVLRGGSWKWYRAGATAIDRLDRNAQHDSVAVRLIRKEVEDE